MHIKIYQINKQKDPQRVKFLNLERTIKQLGKVKPTIYKTVFDGKVNCKGWGDVFALFNSSEIPITHQGHSMSVSDVVEVIEAPMLVGRIKFYVADNMFETVDYIDSEKYNNDICEARECGQTIEAIQLKDFNIPSIEPGTYFCDLQEFKKIEFDSKRVAPIEGKKILIVEPHKLPYKAIIKDDYRSWQKVVGGTFECIYPFNDDAFMIVNDEGKINGLEGNRMVDGDIIAGNIIIANDDGRGGTVDLTDKQIAEYSKQFSNFEAYTQDEVQSSAYMYFMEFN